MREKIHLTFPERKRQIDVQADKETERFGGQWGWGGRGVTDRKSE